MWIDGDNSTTGTTDTTTTSSRTSSDEIEVLLEDSDCDDHSQHSDGGAKSTNDILNISLDQKSPNATASIASLLFIATFPVGRKCTNCVRRKRMGRERGISGQETVAGSNKNK
jgi:hypothetical protein